MCVDLGGWTWTGDLEGWYTYLFFHRGVLRDAFSLLWGLPFAASLLFGGAYEEEDWTKKTNGN